MARFLLNWELDQNKIPEDPKTRATAWGQLIGMIKQDIEKGMLKDWGAITGQMNGFTIFEGTETDVLTFVQQYTPWVRFTTHPIVNVREIEEMIRNLSEG
jgi:hypothetical protein